MAYKINLSQDEIINAAKRDYNLELQGLELKPIKPPATNNLYENSVIAPRWPESHPFHWLNQAEKGDREAMIQLGIIYDRDDEIEKAVYWYQKAIDAGNEYGKERLARFQRQVE